MTLFTLTIIWVSAGQPERRETLQIYSCPTPYQVQQYAASDPMKRDWRIRKWTCE